MISKTIDVVVTSVLQTTAGKMIFGRYIDPNLASQAGQPASGISSHDEPRRTTRHMQPAQAASPSGPVTPIAAAPAGPAVQAGPPVTGK
jgi:hypothetical protein